VLEEDSFTLAARRLGVSQSTVSTTIRQLERSLGGRLLHRRHPPLSPTRLGEIVAEQAREICAAVRDVRCSADAYRDARGRTLRVGVCSGGVGRAKPLVLAAFARIPELSVIIVNLNTVDQLARLLDGSVDAVLTFGPFADERLTCTPLFEQARIAVVGEHHALADATTLTVADLLDRPHARSFAGYEQGWADFWFLVPERNGEQPRRAPGLIDTDLLARLRGYRDVDVITIAPAYLADYAPEATLGVRYLTVEDLTPATAVLVTRRGDPHTRLLPTLATHLARDEDADVLVGAGRGGWTRNVPG
jgi:DNA-binding transcriptional LysR family regulator